jgi:L-cysteine desulfidase
MLILVSELLFSSFMDTSLIHQIIVEEVSLALGCTEPAAVALSASLASRVVKGEVLSVEVFLDPNTFKNASAVHIPKAVGYIGPEIAAALGALAGNPKLKLQVLRNVRQRDLKKAKLLLEKGRVRIGLNNKKRSLWVQSKVTTTKGKGEAIIAGYHSHIYRVKLNGRITFRGTPFRPSKDVHGKLARLSVFEIYNLLKRIEKRDKEFLLEGLDVNMAIAQEGILKKSGLGVGAFFRGQMDKKVLAEDVISEAKMLIAGAADARMGGLDMPVMATSGSGNQGIVVTLTIGAVARKHECNKAKTAQALALGHLLTSYVKFFTGRLSALCGCTIAAGIGASAGVVNLLGGSFQQLEWAIRNVIGDITGIICDGAKQGCSLKLSTAAESAIRAALMAMEGITIPAGEGIIDTSIDQTIRNLSRISEAMREVDRKFMEILNERKVLCNNTIP